MSYSSFEYLQVLLVLDAKQIIYQIAVTTRRKVKWEQWEKFTGKDTQPQENNYFGKKNTHFAAVANFLTPFGPFEKAALQVSAYPSKGFLSILQQPRDTETWN